MWGWFNGYVTKWNISFSSMYRKFTNEMLQCLEFAFICSNSVKLSKRKKRWNKNNRTLWLMKLNYGLTSVNYTLSFNFVCN